MAELKLRREGLEKMNQDFSKKIEEGKTKTGYGVETLPLNSYTFKGNFTALFRHKRIKCFKCI